MLHLNDRIAAFTNTASKSTPTMQRSRNSSPQGTSLTTAPDSENDNPLIMKKGKQPDQEILRSAPQLIIMTTANVTLHQAALSLTATRRNMLQTELAASLRHHRPWERQQKNQIATTVLKQRHTASDLSQLNMDYSLDPILAGTIPKDDDLHQIYLILGRVLTVALSLTNIPIWYSRHKPYVATTSCCNVKV
jgi:hypothetical protein